MPASTHIEVGTTPTLLYTGDEWDATVVRFVPIGFTLFLGGSDVAVSGATGGELILSCERVTVICAPREKWYGIRESSYDYLAPNVVTVCASTQVGA